MFEVGQKRRKIFGPPSGNSKTSYPSFFCVRAIEAVKELIDFLIKLNIDDSIFYKFKFYLAKYSFDHFWLDQDFKNVLNIKDKY